MRVIATRLLVPAVVALFAAVFVASGPASALTVLNPSFEVGAAGGLPNPCGSGCSYSTGTIPDWTLSGTGGLFQPGSAGYFNQPVPNGITVAWLNGAPSGDPHGLGGYLYQQVGTVQVGTTYTLNVDVGYRTDVDDNGVIALQVGGTTVDFYGVAQTPAVQGSGDWVDYTATFTGTNAEAGQALYVVLFSGNSGQADFDNVSLAVPEPGIWAMMLAGFGVLGFMMRGSRRKQPCDLATA